MATPDIGTITRAGRAGLGLLRGVVDFVRGVDRRTPEQKAAALDERAEAVGKVAATLRADAGHLRRAGLSTPHMRREWKRVLRRADRLERKVGRLSARAARWRA